MSHKKFKNGRERLKTIGNNCKSLETVENSQKEYKKLNKNHSKLLKSVEYTPKQKKADENSWRWLKMVENC